MSGSQSTPSTGGSPAWITSLLCPALGCVICNLMWLSPMKVSDIIAMPKYFTIPHSCEQYFMTNWITLGRKQDITRIIWTYDWSESPSYKIRLLQCKVSGSERRILTIVILLYGLSAKVNRTEFSDLIWADLNWTELK